MSSGGRGQVVRFGHGSRVPGWDDPVDLTKDPAVVPDPATTPVPQALREEIEAAMARYPDPRSATIPALHAAQQFYGWCSPEAITQVAAVMALTPADLTSVASFYDMLELSPRPLHNEFYEAMIAAAAEDPSVHVRSFECLGACDIAPMASVNGEYVGPLQETDAAQIVEDLAAGRPVLPDKQLRFRPSADPSARQ